MAELNSVEKYILNRTAEANYGLWNALLTVNGILVSAFSLVITLVHRANKTLVGILVISCAISLFLILWNYLTTKWHYIEIGKSLSSENFNLSEEQKVADINKCYRRHKSVIWREYIALILLLLEIALVVFIVFTTKTAA